MITTGLHQFMAAQPFELDDFQIKSCQALERGESVLVAAPTGSGKTIVAEFAVAQAIAGGVRLFYTTPIKALSNQKYHDLVRIHGSESVGLLTGDTSINPDAAVVVMTTEVLRNMLYEGGKAARRLDHLEFVVLDEVHYLADRFRGPVWEEVILHLPSRVQIVALSATVSNYEEFGNWLQSVRGPITTVVSRNRPVPLDHHVLVGRELFPLFHRTKRRSLAPGLLQAAHQYTDRRRRRSGLQRLVAIDQLNEAGLLPAITFIFSRAGCDGAVDQLRSLKVNLTTKAEAAQIRAIVEARCAGLSESDRQALNFYYWRNSLIAGIAAHHAGMVPLFKETVEELFIGGLLKVVFATETLALGVNMPARSVVLEQLDKWDGVHHAPLSAGQYAQLTGRAGRRGIDIEGHAVVVYTPDVDLHDLARLASATSYPLHSAFHPTYNMAVNLIHTTDAHRAREILDMSFAQFQTDRAVVDLAAHAQSLTQEAEALGEEIACDRGDVLEYLGIQRAIKQREKKLASQRSRAHSEALIEVFEGLKPGDIVGVPSGRRRGYNVVISHPRPRRGTLEVAVINDQGRNRTLLLSDCPDGITIAASMKLPRRFAPTVVAHRRDAAATMAATLGVKAKQLPPRPKKPRSGAHNDPQLAELKSQLLNHPVHECPQLYEHQKLSRQYFAVREDADRTQQRLSRRTGTLGHQFDAVCAVLTSLGYLEVATTPQPSAEASQSAPEPSEQVPAKTLEVTDAGMLLRRIYAERDLVLAECVRHGVWKDSSPAELAAGIASVIYESRSDREVSYVPEQWEDVVSRTNRIAQRVSHAEKQAKVGEPIELHLGLVHPIGRWAEGADLDEVLNGADFAPGDFVRWAKQVLDVLGQLITVAPQPALRASAEEAMDGIRRGVVALDVSAPTNVASS